MKRLNHDATTDLEVFQYYQTRALQLSPLGYKWIGHILPADGGFTTSFFDGTDRIYNSYYGLAQFRGNGHAKKVMSAFTYPVLTVDDCNIVDFMRANNIPHKVAHGIFDSVEYQMVESFYGDERAKRSGVLKMNHIDEGVYIMTKLGASDKAMKAFCLHPLLQQDEEMAVYFERCTLTCNSLAVMLALEYRNVANGWLSDKVWQTDGLAPGVTWDTGPKLSPLPSVNAMLIADKIQNYKDFLIYHAGKHARSDELDAYFRQWLHVLQIDDFDLWFKELSKLYK